MTVNQQFRRGIRKALKITDLSTRQVSLKAGYNEHQVNRFLKGMDIKLSTLDDICNKGLGIEFETVYRMGK